MEKQPNTNGAAMQEQNVTALRHSMVKTISILLLAAAVAATVPRGPVGIPPSANLYRARITREAHAAAGLAAPVAMLGAQVETESMFNESAKSGCGAQGLAQFTPQTAAWIANLYPADLKPGLPFSAAWAIRALVKYDFYLYQKLPTFQEGNERWSAALASYNGGLSYTKADQAAAQGCDASRWFGCVENVKDKRSPASLSQNRAYPTKIMQLQPLYAAAGWR